MHEALLRELNRVRSTLGEDAFRAACRNYAKEFVRQGPQGSAVAKNLLRDFLTEVDFAEIDAEVSAEGGQSAPSPDRMMVEVLRAQMPALKTQAQFNAFMASFEALRALASYIFEGNEAAATQARVALDQAIEAIRLSTDITKRLEEVPEAATGPGSDDFKRPPSQFEEYDVQRRLLGELEKVGDLVSLTNWYQRSRLDIDRVVSQSLRNVLLDAIRAKKVAFEAT